MYLKKIKIHCIIMYDIVVVLIINGMSFSNPLEQSESQAMVSMSRYATHLKPSLVHIF